MSLGNILIPRLADWPLAIRASRTVIATVEERVAGPLQEEADWRLIPAIHLSALVHCPGGAAPTGYPGYYDLDEGQIALYLQSAKDPAAWADYLQKYVFQKFKPLSTRLHTRGRATHQVRATQRVALLYSAWVRGVVPALPLRSISPTLPPRRSPRRLRGAPPPGPGSSR